MTSIIVADQLTKWYGARLAVDHVSLQVEAGEVMGLLGPNGSGKTTILRILTGYLLPSSGTARIAGLDVVDDTLAARAQVGYVPEDVPLYGWMSVREFLAFMARLKGLAGQAATGSVEAVVERLALGDVRRILIGKLSRGYRQRVADRVAILLGGRLLGVRALGGGDSGQRISMRVRGPEEAVRTCLAGVPGVQRVTVEPLPGGELATCVVDSGAGPIAEALAAAVVGAGLGLLDMTPVHVDLETLFLGLTSGHSEERP